MQLVDRIRAKTCKGHQQMIASEDVDRIHLDRAQTVEDVKWGHQRRIAEALGAQRQSARLLGRQAGGHLQNCGGFAKRDVRSEYKGAERQPPG